MLRIVKCDDALGSCMMYVPVVAHARCLFLDRVHGI
jgi:hypothetical protein